MGAGWRDCQRLVTKHLPADRFAISPGNVVTVRKKNRDRGEPERREAGGGGVGTEREKGGSERVDR